MTDTRIFRITYASGAEEYCPRQGAQQKYNYGKRGKGNVLKVFATNAEATDGWTDVTEEFAKRHDSVLGKWENE